MTVYRSTSHPRPAPDTTSGSAHDWRGAAACRSEDPELFFPRGATGEHLVQAERAKRVCERCPVRLRCLEDALAHRAQDGVWGGLDQGERRALAAQHRQAAHVPLEALLALVDTRRRRAQAKAKRASVRAARDAGVRRLWAQGKSDPQIAIRLGLSVNGVRGIRRRLGLTAHRNAA